MTTQTVNLDTYSLSLLTAKEDILNPRSSTNWALFMYDGVSNKLKLADSGAGGVSELAGKLQISKPQYGLCSVGSVTSGGPQIAMIIWVGQDVDEYRRTECASHVPAIKSFFKEVHVFISAEQEDDVTEERIGAELTKVQACAPAERVRRSSRSVEKEEMVGTNYRKTNAAMEMRKINRDSFWARAEREEEERKEQERKRAAEEERRLERERIMKERREAEERDRKMNEKLQMIEEQRREQAEQDEELRRREKSRWEQEQREHEEDMRARLRRSESIEKAAEAAALVSQRSMNPREFFRQLSSSSSPSSPGSPRTVKGPFRRYQRSLTDTAFIFSRPDDGTALSPRSPPLVAPFSRTPSSPVFRVPSPPVSPSFHPMASPPRLRAPLISPPPSPAHSAPVSALSSVPVTSPRPRTPSPTPPSAPPASPSHLASVTPAFPQSQPDSALPPSPPMTPPQSQQEQASMHFEASPLPQAPTAPLPESPLNTADMHTELVSAKGYTAQAVLVEEDEEDAVEEDEDDEAQPEAQPGPGPGPEPSLATSEPFQVMEEKEDPEQLVELVQEEEEEEEEEAEHGGLENDQSIYSRAAVEPVTSQLSEEEEESVTDADAICQHIKQEAVVVTTNGITNGEERSLSPSDTELNSPELAVCYSLHGTAEEDYVAGDEDQEISENGEEDVPERQMCVRALYDYQAEDESEISFEPGDIISDVETVDKAWWRGYSKDGRQGLFPANYVETI